jgi:hypothetical protein
MPVDLAVLRRLYTGPPSEFVAARNAAAKELKAAGDRETAAEVAKLRRPSVQDWALNTVAVEHRDEMGAALDAAARMRDAQAAAVEGRGGSDVRGAVAELRERSQRVVSLAADAVADTGRAPGSLLGTLAARLGEVAASETAAEQLRAGHLGSESVEAVDLFAGLTPPPVRAKQADREASPPERPGRGQRTKAETGTSERPRRDAQTTRRLERAVAAARKAQVAADAALVKAESRVEAAGEAMTAAEATVEAARSRLAAARDEAHAASEQSVEAHAALEAAEAALAEG